MNARPLSDFAAFSDVKMQKLSVFQSARFFCDVYCLLPGQAQKPHAHPASDKVYVVLEGSCRFKVGPVEQELGPGAAVWAPAGEEHGVQNASSAPARLLVFMAPPPDHA